MWNWLKRLFSRKEEQYGGNSKDCPQGRIILSQLPRGTNCSIVNSNYKRPVSSPPPKPSKKNQRTTQFIQPSTTTNVEPCDNLTNAFLVYSMFHSHGVDMTCGDNSCDCNCGE